MFPAGMALVLRAGLAGRAGSAGSCRAGGGAEGTRCRWLALAVLSAIKTQPGHGAHKQSARFGSRVQVGPLPAGACRSQPTSVQFIPAKCWAAGKKTSVVPRGVGGQDPAPGGCRAPAVLLPVLVSMRPAAREAEAGRGVAQLLTQCSESGGIQHFIGETMEQIWKRINML